ncbi:CDP-glucose 4,6-dehydratase [Parvibium lacunae]|uniref:CDP-glucose 4,6-dehydratase n=1 Tax=Parvibium lacunae TaxID=1888893 RepID=A0A368L3S9_9BURK|nr:CDP-glucose 4,6-dehydratase [Parvibium lacunae]RCS58214.1 CDP-glucose 4,6-dehydratase [Parvibium lacunae]
MTGLLAPPNPSFWRQKKVLVTGHTGFKGAWLSHWLHRLGAEVIGVALPPPTTSPSLFSALNLDKYCHHHIQDIRDHEGLNHLMQQYQPEIIFHLAAQSLVRTSYRDPLTTFSSNVMGTVHVLEACRHLPTLRMALMITTDKVYAQPQQGVVSDLEHDESSRVSRGFAETDRLGGHDPYSASKAAAELAIQSYIDSFLGPAGKPIAVARAGNVIGGGDWSAERLIPDAIHAWSTGTPLEIRHPGAIRPWQHVLEPLYSYLQLAEKIWHRPNLAGAYNLGPDLNATAEVQSVVRLAAQCYHQQTSQPATVDWPASSEPTAASATQWHEAACLRLNTQKALEVFGLRPVWPLSEAIERTIAWYARFQQGDAAMALCNQDIQHFEACLKGHTDTTEDCDA